MSLKDQLENHDRAAKIEGEKEADPALEIGALAGVEVGVGIATENQKRRK